MNNKGFAVSGILYSMLLMFLVLIVMLLFNLQNKKTILDELKSEAVRAVEEDNEIDILREEINNLKSDTYIFINSHPVGSIYVTVANDEASVAAMESKYPDTDWEVYGAGRTLIGVGTGNDGVTSMTFNANSTGGEYNHTLSIDEMPSHTHSHNAQRWWGDKWTPSYTTTRIGLDVTIGHTNASISNAGGDQPHNNLQPYITVYMYKRIA